MVAEKELNKARLGLCLRQKTGSLRTGIAAGSLDSKKTGIANGHWVGALSWIFFLNNYKIQTILLVRQRLKLISFLTIRVQRT